MKTYFQLGVAFVLVALSGCAINLNLSTVRFETPETQGLGGAGEVGVGEQIGTELQVVADTTSSPIDQTNAYNAIGITPFKAEVGLLDRLDIGLSASSSTAASPISLKAKYQFIGEPRRTSDPGNFSMAATLAGGIAYKSGTDESEDIFSTNQTIANYTLHAWDVDGALLFGYRSQSWLMVYGGPFYTHYGYSGWVQQSGESTDQLNFSGAVNEEGVDVGLSFEGQQFAIRPEFSMAACQSTGSSGLSVASGVMVLFHW
jgi:hypothetical protein